MTGPATGAGPAVRFHRFGIEVEQGLFWLDSRRKRPFGVVSHAHGDHVARHDTILCTPETGALFRKRNGPGPRFMERRYGEKTPVGDLTVTLLPAGHILGSAMVLVEGRGGSLLYTGDVRPAGGITCPPAEVRHADVLITEATFGHPDHRLPPAEESRARLVAHARDALDDGRVPVFLAYSLGKGQEVMVLLGRAGIPVAAHGAVWNLCPVYRRFGVRFPCSRRLADRPRRDCAIVVPPRHRHAAEVRAQAPLWVVAVTGWGRRALARGIDAVVPLSDHADYGELLHLVDGVAPSRVHVVHGYAPEFASSLRQRGYAAHAVAGHSGPDTAGPGGLWGA
ncbi:MAG: MBL fold metallo-hydrolase [Planctomycetota bacterium]